MRPLDEYPHTQPDRCAVCGAEVVWVRGVSGAYIPVNPEPVQGGEVTIIAGFVQPPTSELLGLVLGPDQRYTQHLKTCPELRTQEAREERIKQAVSKPIHPHSLKLCKCGAAFFLAPSAKGNGKKLPLCAEPNPTGNFFLNDKHEAVSASENSLPPPGSSLYLDHSIVCRHVNKPRA